MASGVGAGGMGLVKSRSRFSNLACFGHGQNKRRSWIP